MKQSNIMIKQQDMPDPRTPDEEQLDDEDYTENVLRPFYELKAESAAGQTIYGFNPAATDAEIASLEALRQTLAGVLP